MGIGFTSCMNGENNSIVSRPIFARLIEYSIPDQFKDAGGMRIVPSSALVGSEGDMFYLYCQYDQSLITENSTSVNVTLLTTPICIDGPALRGFEVTPDAPLREWKDSNEYPFYFDKNTLICPITYWVKYEADADAQKKELAKHSFIISYDPASFTVDSKELVLTMNDIVDDAEDEVVKRDKYTNDYKSYNLSSALYDFKVATGGNSPVKIVIKAKVNSSKNTLEDATDSSIELSYDFKD